MSTVRFLTALGVAALLALPVAAQTASPSTSTSRPPAAAPSSTNRMGAATSTQQQVDINSATSAELDKLPGIGPARAQAIIANRPYKGKDELAQRKIVPQNVYDQIKDKIVARQTSSSSGSGSSNPMSRSATPSK
jgi:competence protein ComEA